MWMMIDENRVCAEREAQGKEGSPSHHINTHTDTHRHTERQRLLKKTEGASLEKWVLIESEGQDQNLSRSS
jgi:hypothetical protein